MAAVATWGLARIVGRLASCGFAASTNGLRNGLALLLYGFGSSLAGMISGNGQSLLDTIIGGPLREIGGALILGVTAGWMLAFVIKRRREQALILAISVGLILLVVGLARALDFDVILSAMVLGLIRERIGGLIAVSLTHFGMSLFPAMFAMGKAGEVGIYLAWLVFWLPFWHIILRKEKNRVG